MKLNLGCGGNRMEGYTGVDILPGPAVDVVHDLLVFPWPFEAGAVEDTFCSHFIEHIPLVTLPNGQDLFFAFFDELYRVMAVGAKATFIAPWYGSVRAWQDPTHRRAISDATFLYLNKAWRVAVGIGHYQVACDFDTQFSYATQAPWHQRSEEARTFAFSHYMNVINDVNCVLTKRAPE